MTRHPQMPQGWSSGRSVLGRVEEERAEITNDLRIVADELKRLPSENVGKRNALRAVVKNAVNTLAALSASHAQPSEYDAHKAMMAALQAMARVRDGDWVKGAPTHVLAEFLNELRADGWELRRSASHAAQPDERGVE